MNTTPHMRVLAPLALGAVVFLFSALSIEFVEHGASFALVWPANAIAIAALIRWRPAFGATMVGVAASLSGILLANLACGAPLELSLGFTLANSVEIAVAYHIIRRPLGLHHQQVARPARLIWRVLVASLAGPFVGGLFGGGAVAFLVGDPLLMAAARWWLSSCLSMMVVLTLALAFEARPARMPNVRTALVAVLIAFVAPVLATWLAFLSGRVAFMVLSAPIIFFAAIRYRTNGAIAAITAVGVASMVFVADKSLVIAFRVWSDPGELVALIQVYLVVQMIIALALANLLDERDELSAALERQIDLARRQSEGRLRLLMNIAHDIRTPLGVINGGMELLQLNERSGHRDQRVQVVAAVSRAAGQLQALASDLLDQSRVEAGKVSIAPELFSPHVVLEEIIEAERAGRPDSARITLQVRDGLNVWADPLRFRQIATNLVSNAVKYAGAHGSIDVHVHQRLEATVLVVVDRGPGFAPGQEQVAFEPFGLPRSLEEGGIGVGLSLVRQLVEAHGGEVSLVSRPYVETRFEATFPHRGAAAGERARLDHDATRPIDPAAIMDRAKAS